MKKLCVVLCFVFLFDFCLRAESQFDSYYRSFVKLPETEKYDIILRKYRDKPDLQQIVALANALPFKVRMQFFSEIVSGWKIRYDSYDGYKDYLREGILFKRIPGVTVTNDQLTKDITDISFEWDIRDSTLFLRDRAGSVMSELDDSLFMETDGKQVWIRSYDSRRTCIFSNDVGKPLYYDLSLLYGIEFEVYSVRTSMLNKLRMCARAENLDIYIDYFKHFVRTVRYDYGNASELISVIRDIDDSSLLRLMAIAKDSTSDKLLRDYVFFSFLEDVDTLIAVSQKIESVLSLKDYLFSWLMEIDVQQWKGINDISFDFTKRINVFLQTYPEYRMPLCDAFFGNKNLSEYYNVVLFNLLKTRSGDDDEKIAFRVLTSDYLKKNVIAKKGGVTDDDYTNSEFVRICALRTLGEIGTLKTIDTLKEIVGELSLTYWEKKCLDEVYAILAAKDKFRTGPYDALVLRVGPHSQTRMIYMLEHHPINLFDSDDTTHWEATLDASSRSVLLETEFANSITLDRITFLSDDIDRIRAIRSVDVVTYDAYGEKKDFDSCAIEVRGKSLVVSLPDTTRTKTIHLYLVSNDTTIRFTGIVFGNLDMSYSLNTALFYEFDCPY